MELGKILKNNARLTEADLDQALHLQNTSQGEKRIGEILSSNGFISEDEVQKALAEQLDLPFHPDLGQVTVPADIVRKIPLAFAQKNMLVPVSIAGNLLTIATLDPLNIQPLDDIGILLGLSIRQVITTKTQIESVISTLYSQSGRTAQNIVADIQDSGESDSFDSATSAGPEDILNIANKGPIIRLVNTILNEAVNQRASDIHIEPFSDSLRVRFRIDGILHEHIELESKLQPAILSRIKIMSQLNIAEKRVAQDGRTSIRIANHDVDIRISVIPTSYGERIVMRLLEQEAILYDLRDIGFPEEIFHRFQALINNINGIILVTGPTGSGKTTTLYAALNRLNSIEKNILTIEDPVEYHLRGVGQIAVNPKVGLTFSNGLRSILRQDPDVIMIGEIRDEETAQIAIQASLTGHLVFSTLHTNDAAGAITRLIDMGVEPYLVSSSLCAVLAQRLVRTLCPQCKKPLQNPDPAKLCRLGIDLAFLARGAAYMPVGCEHCLNTGYKGRIGIYELLPVNSSLHKLINEKADSITIKQSALENELFTTLREDGLDKVLAGRTSLDEILRVT